MKVAICDDNDKLCEELNELIDMYRSRRQLNIEVDIFLSGSEMISNIKSGEYYDMIFLDIELEEMRLGSDIGIYLRTELDNQTTKIVYISAHTQYALRLFNSRPLDFIEKPITMDKIIKVFDAYNTISNVDEDFIQVAIESATHYVKCRNIIFFTKKLRKVYIVTTDDEYETYYNLDDAEKLRGFLRIHKSHVININYVKVHTYRQIEMTNGKILPISQKYRNEVKRLLKLF